MLAGTQISATNGQEAILIKSGGRAKIVQDKEH